MNLPLVRWGARGFAAVVAIWAVGWAPIFDWMAPERIEHLFERKPEVPSPRHVFLISIDGLAASVLETTPTPVLDRLAREGTTARSATTVVPSITLTSHASMLSGASPDAHGIRFNRYQPWSRLELETVFTWCDRLGLRCGLFAGKKKFAHFAEFERGVEIYDWSGDALSVLDEALHYVRLGQPDFTVIHLAEVDWAGHDDGWGSDEQREALEQIDSLLGRFFEKVEDLVERPFAVIVTSDHGGHGEIHGTAAPEDTAIPWIAWGDGISASTLEHVDTQQTASTVLSLLGQTVPEGWPPPAL